MDATEAKLDAFLLAFASCVARVPRHCVQFVSGAIFDGLPNDQLGGQSDNKFAGMPKGKRFDRIAYHFNWPRTRVISRTPFPRR